MTTPTASPHSLHLDERQRAMLQAMGVTHWWPTEAQADSQESPPAQPDTPDRAQAPTAASTRPQSATRPQAAPADRI